MGLLRNGVKIQTSLKWMPHIAMLFVGCIVYLWKMSNRNQTRSVVIDDRHKSIAVEVQGIARLNMARLGNPKPRIKYLARGDSGESLTTTDFETDNKIRPVCLIFSPPTSAPEIIVQ